MLCAKDINFKVREGSKIPIVNFKYSILIMEHYELKNAGEYFPLIKSS